MTGVQTCALPICQRDAGSRVLFDHLMSEAGVEAGAVGQVDPPARNEADVALAVAEGKAEGGRERDRQLAAATAELEQETNRVREELRGQVSAIAVASAEKILKREIDDKAHEDILGKLAQEL